MNYQELLQLSHKPWDHEIKLSLERIEALMNELGNPEKQLSFIHVAGTNGKGSCVTLMANLCAMSGLRVGVYTSPYIERFTDRIRILDGAAAVQRRWVDSSEGEIAEERLAELCTRIREKNQLEHVKVLGEASIFELLTAAALLYFYEENCDIVVLETGLGGRLDATNVIPPPLCVLITALGYDHCEYLGNSLPEIAAEKAAIIKAGTGHVFLFSPFLAEEAPEAGRIYELFARRCSELDVPLHCVAGEVSEALPFYNAGREGRQRPLQKFRLATYPHMIETALLGVHQRLNIALVLEAWQVLFPEQASADFVAEALRLSYWPGRLEQLSAKPYILADGAHNPQAAKVLGLSLQELGLQAVDGQIILLCAVLQDKDFNKMLALMHDYLGAAVGTIICTEVETKRCLPAGDLAQVCAKTWKMQNLADIITEPDSGKAFDLAYNLAERQGKTMVAFGSLYLLSTIREHYFLTYKET